MPSASKNKGSGFEREICKFLSELYNEPFVRIPNSGAYVGGKNTHRKTVLDVNQSKSFKGDINPPDSWPKFNAEAKFYADFGFHQLYTSSKQIDDWIRQLMIASDPGDMNILLMKFNRKGRFVAVQANLGWDTSCNYMTYRSSNIDWMIYELETFFKLNSDLVKKLSQTNTQNKATLLEAITQV